MATACASAVPAQMWQGLSAVPAQMWRGERSPGADVAGEPACAQVLGWPTRPCLSWNKPATASACAKYVVLSPTGVGSTLQRDTCNVECCNARARDSCGNPDNGSRRGQAVQTARQGLCVRARTHACVRACLRVCV
jgi:hypothetical protein